MRPLSILPAAALVVTVFAADLMGQDRPPRPNLANPLPTRHETSAPKPDKAWPKLVESFAKALVDGDPQAIAAQEREEIGKPLVHFDHEHRGVRHEAAMEHAKALLEQSEPDAPDPFTGRSPDVACNSPWRQLEPGRPRR